MRYQYVVILKKDGEHATDLLSILLCFSSTVIFLSAALRAAHPAYYLFAISGILFGGLLYAVFFSRPPRKPLPL